jgi:hypothetical protein
MPGKKIIKETQGIIQNRLHIAELSEKYKDALGANNINSILHNIKVAYKKHNAVNRTNWREWLLTFSSALRFPHLLKSLDKPDGQQGELNRNFLDEPRYVFIVFS